MMAPANDFRFTLNGTIRDSGTPDFVDASLAEVPVAEPAPMDFSAWCKVYLGGRWCTFDARHNKPRIGRIVVALGRDATDVPLVHSFGPHVLKTFKVWTDEVVALTPVAA